jgi:hypothetical protein
MINVFVHGFIWGLMAGMFGCALLFRYTLWMAERREEAMRYMRIRVAAPWRLKSVK